jgi:hypothetical protein
MLFKFDHRKWNENICTLDMSTHTLFFVRVVCVCACVRVCVCVGVCEHECVCDTLLWVSLLRVLRPCE